MFLSDLFICRSLELLVCGSCNGSFYTNYFFSSCEMSQYYECCNMECHSIMSVVTWTEPPFCSFAMNDTDPWPD